MVSTKNLKLIKDRIWCSYNLEQGGVVKYGVGESSLWLVFVNKVLLAHSHASPLSIIVYGSFLQYSRNSDTI